MAGRPAPSLTDFISKHLVALYCRYEWTEQSALIASDVYSGFVLEFDSAWFWCTAAHCLLDIKEKQKSANLKPIDCGFMDYFGLESQFRHSIPYSYDESQLISILDERDGIDFGLIPLRENTMRLFEANKVVPLNAALWADLESEAFDVYKILGIPASSVLKDDGGDISGVRPLLLDVVREDEEQLDAWFVARIAAGAQIESIVGMSGGPIFGFREDADGRWRYKVVALQSRWIPDQRLIMATAPSVFAEKIGREIEQ